MTDIGSVVDLLKEKGWGLFVVDSLTAYDPIAIASRGAVNTIVMDTYYHLMPYADTPENVLTELENARMTGQPPYFKSVQPSFIVDGIIFKDDAVYLQPLEYDAQLKVPYIALNLAISNIAPYNPKIRSVSDDSKSEFN